MIAPMKKIHLFFLDETSADEALLELRQLGVLHVEEKDIDTEALKTLNDRKAIFQKADHILAAFRSGESPSAGLPAALRDIPLEEAAGKICALHDELRICQRNIDRLKMQTASLGGQPSFNPHDLFALRRKGVHVFLYELPVKLFTQLSAPNLFILRRFKASIFFAQVCLQQSEKLPFPEKQLPDQGLMETEASLGEEFQRLEAIQRELLAHAGCTTLIRECLDALRDSIRLQEVRLSMECHEVATCLSGYVPEEETPAIRNAAMRRGWGLWARPPGPQEHPPTLVRYSKPFGIVKPVFDILETVPGYAEKDISGFFLFFFCIFFSMIIGDAGYGCIFILMAVFGHLISRIRKRRPPAILPLVFVMGAATSIWGATTGNWFGSCALCENTVLSRLVIPELYAFNPKSSEYVMLLCFSLGFIQIAIAHLWNFLIEIRQRPHVKALAQIGWLCTLSGVYLLVLNMLLGPDKHPLPSFTLPLIIVGYSSVVLLSKQEGDFLEGALTGLANIVPITLNKIGLFSDVISYIRLFAVGLASLNIAVSFNQMAHIASGAAFSILAPLILFIGHSLNFVMGMLSVVVHGIRLNMLEFSGHLGMEWTGYPYRPFKLEFDNVTVERIENGLEISRD